MHLLLLDLIKCPVCGFERLEPQVFEQVADGIQEGTVTCQGCKTWFRIEGGILDLLPLDLRRWTIHQEFAKRHHLVSKKEVSPGEIPKNEQIAFFAVDSAAYEKEVTNSPCFMALDHVTVGRWLEKNGGQCRRLFDLGCGTGRQTIRAAESGFTVIGADISEEMLKIAERSAVEKGISDRVDLLVADAERLPVRDAAFDACISIGTLHHVPHPDLVIREACRVTNSTGTMLFYDPHKSPVRFIFDFLMRIWKLYDEKASEDPLMTEADMKSWLSARNTACTTRLSVFLPPHVFYLLNHRWNVRLLAATDRLFNAIPGLRKCGGILVTEAAKREPK